MERKEYKLNENTNDFRIDANVYDISVHSDNVESPILLYTGDVDVENEWHAMHDGMYAKISERQKINIQSKNFIGNINGFNNVVINGNSVFVTNGSVIINGNVLSNDNVGNMELIIPKKNMSTVSLKVENISGDVKVKNLMLQRMIIESVSGDITLDDITSLYLKLKAISGDIDARIMESMLNYYVKLSSISGETTQRSVETKQPQIVYDKSTFEAETISGDIKVLFKGKNN